MGVLGSSLNPGPLPLLVSRHGVQRCPRSDVPNAPHHRRSSTAHSSNHLEKTLKTIEFNHPPAPALPHVLRTSSTHLSTPSSPAQELENSKTSLKIQLCLYDLCSRSADAILNRCLEGRWYLKNNTQEVNREIYYFTFAVLR